MINFSGYFKKRRVFWKVIFDANSKYNHPSTSVGIFFLQMGNALCHANGDID